MSMTEAAKKKAKAIAGKAGKMAQAKVAEVVPELIREALDAPSLPIS